MVTLSISFNTVLVYSVSGKYSKTELEKVLDIDEALVTFIQHPSYNNEAIENNDFSSLPSFEYPLDLENYNRLQQRCQDFIDETESEEFIKREWHEIDRSLRTPKCLKVFYN